MRYKLYFRAKESIILPLSYHQLLQGFVYKLVSDGNRQYAEELHDVNCEGVKQFKFFSFGKIYSKQKRIVQSEEGKKIEFDSKFCFSIGCMDSKMDQALLQVLNHKKKFRLGIYEVELVKYQVYLYDGSEKIRIKMDSPITVRRTYVDESGNKKTQYFTPDQLEFYDAVIKNAKEKFESFYGKIMPNLFFRRVLVNEKDKYVTRYKQFLIIGWHGTYEIQGHPAVLRFLYYCGLGAKNSQGFGLFDIVAE